ncbi:MAG: hypothetical protein ABSH34_30670, partial [Verrucomicrobiota bacterium]
MKTDLRPPPSVLRPWRSQGKRVEFRGQEADGPCPEVSPIHPGGMKDGSRGSKRSGDPRSVVARVPHPGTGCQKPTPLAWAAFWHPSGMPAHA